MCSRRCRRANTVVAVTATGFRQLEQAGVIVDALSTVGLNLTLQVGAASETVTITSAPAQLNTSDPRLQQCSFRKH